MWVFCFAHLRLEHLTPQNQGSFLVSLLDRTVVPTLGLLRDKGHSVGHEHFLENYFSLPLPTGLDQHRHLSGLKVVLLQVEVADGSRPAY